MASRRSKANLKDKNAREDEELDEIVQNSQGLESDDIAFTDIVQRFQAGRAKKLKQKETDFLASAKKDIQSSLANSAKGCTEGYNQLIELYQAFQLSYAESEDNIRKIWLEIIKEHETFSTLCGEQETLFKESEEKRVNGYMTGLMSQRNACEYQGRTIALLHPDGSATKSS